MLKPIGSNLIVKVIEESSKTSSGIIIPSAAVEKPYKALVIESKHEFTMPDGSVKKSELKQGDMIFFMKTHGTEVTDSKGEKFLVISEEFIICKEG